MEQELVDRGEIGRVWLPLLLGAAVLWRLFTSPVGTRGPARWVGLGLAVVGLTGVIVSRNTLGRSFAIRAKAIALVTTGIYSRIRNPIYISGQICLLGVVIMVQKPYLLLLFIIIVPIQMWRARKEARVLEEKFGEEYREYRRQTWF